MIGIIPLLNSANSFAHHEQKQSRSTIHSCPIVQPTMKIHMGNKNEKVSISLFLCKQDNELFVVLFIKH